MRESVKSCTVRRKTYVLGSNAYILWRSLTKIIHCKKVNGFPIPSLDVTHMSPGQGQFCEQLFYSVLYSWLIHCCKSPKYCTLYHTAHYHFFIWRILRYRTHSPTELHCFTYIFLVDLSLSTVLPRDTETAWRPYTPVGPAICTMGTDCILKLCTIGKNILYWPDWISSSVLPIAASQQDFRRVCNDTFNLREGHNPGRKPCHKYSLSPYSPQFQQVGRGCPSLSLWFYPPPPPHQVALQCHSRTRPMSSNGLIYAADSLDLALLLTQWRWGAHTQIQSLCP